MNIPGKLRVKLSEHSGPIYTISSKEIKEIIEALDEKTKRKGLSLKDLEVLLQKHLSRG